MSRKQIDKADHAPEQLVAVAGVFSKISTLYDGLETIQTET